MFRSFGARDRDESGTTTNGDDAASDDDAASGASGAAVTDAAVSAAVPTPAAPPRSTKRRADDETTAPALQLAHASHNSNRRKTLVDERQRPSERAIYRVRGLHLFTADPSLGFFFMKACTHFVLTRFSPFSEFAP